MEVKDTIHAKGTKDKGATPGEMYSLPQFLVYFKLFILALFYTKLFTTTLHLII